MCEKQDQTARLDGQNWEVSFLLLLSSRVLIFWFLDFAAIDVGCSSMQAAVVFAGTPLLSKLMISSREDGRGAEEDQ